MENNNNFIILQEKIFLQQFHLVVELVELFGFNFDCHLLAAEPNRQHGGIQTTAID